MLMFEVILDVILASLPRALGAVDLSMRVCYVGSLIVGLITSFLLLL